MKWNELFNKVHPNNEYLYLLRFSDNSSISSV